jgi:hypothetical protein
MPLNLLPHKSWNVYSTANVARVRRDENEAAVREQHRRDMEDADAAAGRLEMLRARAGGGDGARKDAGDGGERKRVDKLGLTGKDGHINLFPAPPDAERGRSKKVEEVVVDLSSALGGANPKETPWYAAVGSKGEDGERAERKKWADVKEGRRKERGDPLMAMKTGARRVREMEREREEWRRERERNVGLLPMVEAGDLKRRQWRRRSAPVEMERRRSRRDRSKSPRHSGRRQRRKHGGEEDRGDKERERLCAERDAREAEERRKVEELRRRERERNTPGWKPVQGGRYSKQFGMGEVRH